MMRNQKITDSEWPVILFPPLIEMARRLVGGEAYPVSWRFFENASLIEPSRSTIESARKNYTLYLLHSWGAYWEPSSIPKYYLRELRDFVEKVDYWESVYNFYENPLEDSVRLVKLNYLYFPNWKHLPGEFSWPDENIIAEATSLIDYMNYC